MPKEHAGSSKNCLAFVPDHGIGQHSESHPDADGTEARIATNAFPKFMLPEEMLRHNREGMFGPADYPFFYSRPVLFWGGVHCILLRFGASNGASFSKKLFHKSANGRLIRITAPKTWSSARFHRLWRRTPDSCPALEVISQKVVK